MAEFTNRSFSSMVQAVAVTTPDTLLKMLEDGSCSLALVSFLVSFMTLLHLPIGDWYAFSRGFLYILG